METIRNYYAFSFAFTAVCFALAGWYGWTSTGSITATLGILWIVVVLSILEVSLSFDNAGSTPLCFAIWTRSGSNAS